MQEGAADGALFVVINPAPNLKMLGLLQGYAAGLMLSISFFDLAHNALNSLGFLKGKLWVGISLHNFPEGMAVFLGSIKGLRVGLNLALAIALHNIPEFHLNKFFTVFRYTLFSKKYTYLFPSSLDPEILEGLLGSVGGVMAFLTLHEMLPLAFDYVGQRQSVKAVFFGMAFMSASLYFLSIGLPEDMSL
ncbi:zinc transporter ZTP29 [Arachis duranensis]|uniref:Zinc transporter ZTP29 n=1 Tax=Arachis duranensis TaxID=130453 RepID=A0A9C6TEW0_ARADU|nr:zinc transporter ZTP29 [Arachis duranensis]